MTIPARCRARSTPISLAYILAVNKFPTGSAEIGIDAAPLKQIRILATKP